MASIASLAIAYSATDSVASIIGYTATDSLASIIGYSVTDSVASIIGYSVTDSVASIIGYSATDCWLASLAIAPLTRWLASLARSLVRVCVCRLTFEHFGSLHDLADARGHLLREGRQLLLLVVCWFEHDLVDQLQEGLEGSGTLPPSGQRSGGGQGNDDDSSLPCGLWRELGEEAPIAQLLL